MKIVRKKINGTVSVPASKSMMQRAIIASLLAKGKSKILNPSICGDTVVALNIAETLGAEISQTESVEIEGIEREGVKREEKKVLYCHESGFCMRVFPAIAGLFKNQTLLTGNPLSPSRPVEFIEEPMNALGVKCKTSNGVLPISVQGPFKGGKVSVDGSMSSQFLSGLLMALPLCENDSELKVSNLKSKDYVRMTLEVLEEFGVEVEVNEEFDCFKINGGQEYKAREYTVEGDWSSAAYFLVAGAIAGSVKVRGLGGDSLQADRIIIDLLKEVGASVNVDAEEVVVEKNELKGFEFDVEECPDLFPVVSVLASNCSGKSVIKGIERLKHKESSRAEVMVKELKRLGVKIDLFTDRVEIVGSLLGGEVESHDDHRIAMALAIAGLNSEKGVEIKGIKCVSKSFPGFFEELKKLGVVENE